MRLILRKATAFVCIILAVCFIYFCAREYIDRQHCVCSILTEKEQTFPIDDRLYRVCEKDTLKSGTLMVVRSICDHGKRLHLTVFPDEGIYKGCITQD